MSSLSVVLIAHNEEATVKSVVKEVFEVVQDLGIDYEIILVNDGSTDSTGVIAHELEKHIINFKMVEHYPRRGYGGALKEGFATARKELIAFFSTDKQYVFSEISRFFKRIGEAGIVSGRRITRKDNLIRKLNAIGWNIIIRLMFGYLCSDIDCGFKMFRREILESVNLVSDGAMIDTELLAGAKARGFRIVEVPVTHLPRLAGKATGADFKVIARAFRDLFSYRLRLNRELHEVER